MARKLVLENPEPRKGPRRGLDTCCALCAKKSWCQRNPTKTRQCCNVARRTPACLALIQARWCSVCGLFEGKVEPFGPNEPELPNLDGKEASSD